MNIYSEIEVVGTDGEDNIYDPEKWNNALVGTLRDGAQYAQERVMAIIDSGIFDQGYSIGRTKNSVYWDETPDGAEIWVDGNARTGAPYAVNQEVGVHEHKMLYLIGARNKRTGELSPIPIKIKGTKETIFVWPNEERIKAGDQFYHPGYEGKYFMKKAIDDTMEYLQTKYPKLLYKVRYGV